MRFIPEALARAVRRHRRVVAAALAGLSVLAALNVVTPSPGMPTVIAARSIAGGAVLTAADLTVVGLPERGVAEGSFTDPQTLIGRRVVARIPRNRVVTDADLLDAEGQLGPGMLALPVRFADNAGAGLLATGSRIDVLGSQLDGAGHAVVASNVAVLTLAETEPGILGGGQDASVVLEVTQAQAEAIAGAAASGPISFAIR